MYHLSKPLVSLSLLCSSLCMSLLSETKILNRCFCLKLIVDEDSKFPKACFLSEVPFINFSFYRSISDGKYPPIFNTDLVMSVPYTGPAFHTYNSKILISTIDEFFPCFLILYSGPS